jgi:hypothetical protein
MSRCDYRRRSGPSLARECGRARCGVGYEVTGVQADFDRERLLGDEPRDHDRGAGVVELDAERAVGRSTTPGAGRSITTPGDAARQPSRSSHVVCCLSGHSSPPARQGAVPRRPARAPRPRTASRSSPPTRPRDLPPLNWARNFRTSARSAGAILARDTSPVTVSIHSAEICAQMLSHPHHQRHATHRPIDSPNVSLRARASSPGHRIP